MNDNIHVLLTFLFAVAALGIVFVVNYFLGG